MSRCKIFCKGRCASHDRLQRRTYALLKSRTGLYLTHVTNSNDSPTNLWRNTICQVLRKRHCFVCVHSRLFPVFRDCRGEIKVLNLWRNAIGQVPRKCHCFACVHSRFPPPGSGNAPLGNLILHKPNEPKEILKRKIWIINNQREKTAHPLTYPPGEGGRVY